MTIAKAQTSTETMYVLYARNIMYRIKHFVKYFLVNLLI